MKQEAVCLNPPGQGVRVLRIMALERLRHSRAEAIPGVSNGIRTRDILDHNQVLYQLSYTHHAPSEGD